ncbi:MAG TPA: hypothetical protein VM510_04755 [Caulifigura sp.]|nr:hypothetical protein [Caulifigura sp.]
MSFGLDIGSSGVRCLYRAGSNLRGRRAPAWYVTLPGGQSERLLLQRAMIPFSSCEGSYIVFGENAAELSRALKLPLIPVLPNGQLPHDDPVGRQVAATLIQSVLPAVTVHRASVAIPRHPSDGRPKSSTDLGQFAVQLLALRGIAATRMHAGTASILAELGDRELTGVGVSLGATSTAFSIAKHGQPIVELTHDQGLDGVDEVVAKSRGKYLFDHEGNRYLDVRSVARWRETCSVNLTSPTDDDQELVRSLVREWLLASMSRFTQELEAARVLRSARGLTTMTITGGPSRMTGMDVLVADAVRRAQLPLKIDEIRTATTSDYTIARGCLIAAELEQKVARRAVA